MPNSKKILSVLCAVSLFRMDQSLFEGSLEVKLPTVWTDGKAGAMRPDEVVLLEVEMSKKCKPLWREAHFKVKSVKH